MAWLRRENRGVWRGDQTRPGDASRDPGALSGSRSGAGDQPLALLLLPSSLEQFRLEQHARALLRIPRVIALEPSRRRVPHWLQESVDVRAARRLELPGVLMVIVLYHPRQYPLARALRAQHERAELWYLAPRLETSRLETLRPAEHGRERGELDELVELDELAKANAYRTLTVPPSSEPESSGHGSGLERDNSEPAPESQPLLDEEPLRERLRALGVISPHAFVPSARLRLR